MTVFSFREIRRFLRYYIDHLPKKGRGEVRRIADHLRVSSTLVSQVLMGEKTFTTEQCMVLSKYLGLSGFEAEYFLYLNLFERAGTHELKKNWESKLEEIKKKSLQIVNRVQVDRKLTDQERATFFSSPLYTSIGLYTSTNHEGKTLDEICERFEISRVRANDILKFLTDIQFCIEKNGRFTLGTQKTHLEKGSPDLLRHHSNWRIRAIRQSEDLSESELMYTAPVSLSKKDFEILREEMVKFIESFLDRVHKSPAEEIACFNLDWFWIKK